MAAAIENLLGILDLEPLEHNLFRGRSPQVGWQRVFGGQVLGQALVAATRTVEPDRKAHSLHAYFLRPGEPGVPIIYEVDRIRDGTSFVTRRVVAIQHGHAIFSMSVSFQVEEPGLDHQMPAPKVPPPEELMAEDVLKQQFLEERQRADEALLAARAADRAAPGQPPPLCEPREARAGAARLVPRHRRASRRSRRSTRRCSPTPPT